MVALTGAGIDYAYALKDVARLQLAVDSTALAVNRTLATEVVNDIPALARGHFEAQVIPGLINPRLTDVEVDAEAGTVHLVASADAEPAFLKAFGIDSFPLWAEAEAVAGDQYLEIALVLDNSGSMAGQRIKDLTTAAKGLVQTLKSKPDTYDKIRFSVVPFAGSVNVGPANATATWMDVNGISPIHMENFATSRNRFDLYKAMKSVSWAGCVEARPYPLDVQDDLPTSANPKSLFVPMFAPDEPSNTSGYYNSYIGDSGGTCTGSSPGDKQSKVCKYDGQTPDTSGQGSTKKGPNYWCDSLAIVPLTVDRATIDTQLGKMAAKGYTNITEGIMWGWRTLSPDAPFTEGTAYGTPKTLKIMVVMTDGANTINGRSNANKSDYSAYGFAAKGRLGTTSGNTATLKAAMDQRMREACANVKATGIRVYTIAFDVDDDATRSLLASCATTPGMAYAPAASSELIPVFASIASQIGMLRLSR